MGKKKRERRFNRMRFRCRIREVKNRIRLRKEKITNTVLWHLKVYLSENNDAINLAS